jgi:hypothetical protein
MQKYYPIDTATTFRAAGAAALTADAYIGTQIDQVGAVYTDAVTVINVEAIKVSAGDEAYTLRVVGSNTANRSDARVLAEFTLGDAAAKPIDTADDVAGEQHVIQFSTQRAGVNQRYIDLHLDVVGTSPSITFSAFMSRSQGM